MSTSEASKTEKDVTVGWFGSEAEVMSLLLPPQEREGLGLGALMLALNLLFAVALVVLTIGKCIHSVRNRQSKVLILNEQFALYGTTSKLAQHYVPGSVVKGLVDVAPGKTAEDGDGSSHGSKPARAGGVGTVGAASGGGKKKTLGKVGSGGLKGDKGAAGDKAGVSVAGKPVKSKSQQK